MAARQHHHAPDNYMQWLRAGAVAVGLAAAVTAGPGVAAATPSESPDPGPATAASETDGADDAGTASAGDASPGVPDQDATSRAGHETDLAGVADAAKGAATGSGAARPNASAHAVGPRRHRLLRADDSDDSGLSALRADVNALRARPAVTAAEPITLALNAAAAAVPPALAALGTPPPPGVMSVTIASQPRSVTTPAAKLTGVVTDALSRIGWGSRTTDLPIPGGPLGSLVESLVLVVRDNQYRSSAPAVGQPGVPGPSPAELDAAVVAALLDRPGVDVEFNPDGTVDNIDGAFTDAKVADAADAARVMNEMALLLGASAGFANPSDITVQRVGATTFYHLRETVGGIPVLGSEVVFVTDSNGTATGLYNYHDRGVESIDTRPDSRFGDDADAIAAARAADIRAMLDEPLGWLRLPAAALSRYDAELVVYSIGDESELAWRVDVARRGRLGIVMGPGAADPGFTYVIDASGDDAGRILAETPHVQYALRDRLRDLFTEPATVTADDVLGNPRVFNVQRFKLLPFDVDVFTDVTRDMRTHRWVGLGMPVNLFGIVLGTVPAIGGSRGYNPAAVSAQANMAKVFDYYKDVLGLNSYDGQGAQVNVVFHFNPFGPIGGLIRPFTNAFWSPLTRMLVFGDGGDFESAVDVIGHEYTHAVFTNAVSQGGGLLPAPSSPENGALNEAYADIMGNLIEGKTSPNPGEWWVGEDSAIGAIRDQKDPPSIPTGIPGVNYPTTYPQRYMGDQDGGGVHINSTIFSHAAYLMMSDVTTTVTKAEWAELFYLSLYALSTDADMSDARDAVEDTAGDQAINLNFDAADLAAIVNAFNMVEIP